MSLVELKLNGCGLSEVYTCVWCGVEKSAEEIVDTNALEVSICCKVCMEVGLHPGEHVVIRRQMATFSSTGSKERKPEHPLSYKSLYGKDKP